MMRAVRSVRSVVASAVQTRGPGGDVRPQVRCAVVEMGRTDASPGCATLAGVPHATHWACWDEKAVQGKASHRSLPGWWLLSTPCRRPHVAPAQRHVVLRLEEQIVKSPIQRA